MFGKKDAYDERQQGGSPLKLALIASAAALAIALVGAGMSFVHEMNEPAVVDGTEGGQPQGGTEGGGQVEEGEPSGPALSEAQKEAVASYGSAERELLDVLCAHSWVNEADGGALSFEGNTLTVKRSGAKPSEYVVALTAVKAGSPTEQVMEGDVKLTRRETETVILTGDGESHFMTLVEESLDGSVPVYTIESEWFPSSGNSYMAVPRSAKLTIDNVDDDLTAAVGGDVAGLTACLREHAETYYPAAEKASWDGTATFNYREDVTVVSFTLDVAMSPTVSVIYDSEAGTFEAGDNR